MMRMPRTEPKIPVGNPIQNILIFLQERAKFRLSGIDPVMTGSALAARPTSTIEARLGLTNERGGSVRGSLVSKRVSR